MLTPLPYGTVETWSTALWEILVLGLFLVWGISVAIRKSVEISLSPLMLPLAGMIVLGLIQIIPFSGSGRSTISFDPYSTLDATIKFLVLTVFLFLFTTLCNTDKRRQQVVTCIVVLSVIIAMIGIGQSYLGKVIWPRASYGPFVNRNHFAGFLEMGIGLAGARVLSHTIRRDRLVLYLCYLIVMITGLVLSASRGGFLSLGGVMLFLALTYARPGNVRRSDSERGANLKLRFAAAVVLLVAMAFGAMFLTSSDELMQRFTTVQQDIAKGELADDRYSRRDLWETSVRIFRDHPMGTGLGAFQFVYPAYDKSSGILRAEQAHNDYVQILVDGGVTGAALALVFMVILFGRGFNGLSDPIFKRRAITAGALAGCFGIAIHSFVDFNLQVTANAQLFLLLAGLATTRGVKEEAPLEPLIEQRRVLPEIRAIR